MLASVKPNRAIRGVEKPRSEEESCLYGDLWLARGQSEVLVEDPLRGDLARWAGLVPCD